MAALVGSTQAYLSDAKDGAATATKYDQEQEQVHGKTKLYEMLGMVWYH